MCRGLYQNHQMRKNITPLLNSRPTLPSIFKFVFFREHSLNDKTTAQARVQMQIVTQLEVQLKKEKVINSS